MEAVAYVSADRASDQLVADDAGHNLMGVAAILSEDLSRSFSEQEGALLRLAEARSEGVAEAELAGRLRDLSRSTFSAAALHDADGKPRRWFATGVEGAGQPDVEFLRSLFLNASARSVARRIDTTLDPPVLLSAVALDAPDGTRAGYVSASIPFDGFAAVLRNAAYGEDGIAYFAGTDGSVVYAPRSETTAKSLGLPVRDGVAEPDPAQAYLVASDPAGPGYVVVAVSKASVTQYLDSLARSLLAAIAGTSLLLLGVVVVLVNRTLKPLLRILPAAQKVKDGDFSVRVRHASDDEMGQLAEAFNSMVESLEARDRQLSTAAREIKRSSEDFQTAIDTLSSAIASTLNVREVMDVACHESVRILQIDAAYLFLEHDGKARLGARAPGTAPEVAEGSDPSGDTLVHHVLSTGKYLVFNRFTLGTVRFPPGLGAGVKSALAVPLRLEDRVQGCLLLVDTVSPIRFTEADVPKATVFAQQVAVALRNSRLFEAAETQRRKFQAVVENANDGILVRVDGRLIFANPALRRMIAEQAFPMTVEEFFARHVHPEDVEGIHERYARRQNGDESPMQYETRFVASDGRVVPVEISAQVIDYDGRRASQMFVRDLTQQKQSESELRHRTDLLLAAEKLAAIGSLAAGVAHEINNPLAFIKGNEQLTQDVLKDILADPNVPAAVKENVREIDESITVNLTGITRIERIVASLRQFAKPSPEKVPFDVNTVVESTLTLSSNRTKNRVQVGKDLSDRIPHVLGNPDEIGQVLLNILLNAVDACPEQDGAIEVRTRRDGGAIVVEITDNGPGIPAEVQRRLFNPFFTTKKTGTGLGLSISQRIVTDHGGSLEYRTGPSKGTTFVVRLPAAPSMPSNRAPGGT